ncbi:MAG: TatD family hydrolase [Verrucomicrobiae bacterium]|nr:TatD family hydrolase [Verrucomicrobiae bacterium]
MNLCDAHNHLHDERYGGDPGRLVAESREAGVVRMVVNGSHEEDWPAVADLARRFPDVVIPAFGLHPWYVHRRGTGWWDRLRRHLDDCPGATVGEIGLDRWILECPAAARAAVSPELAHWTAACLDEQEAVFDAQLTLAAERGLPASVHCLQAWGRLFDRLRNGPCPSAGFLLHSYGGPADMVVPLARLGAYFGFPGYFLRSRKARQRDAFRSAPPDRLLAETDAPDQRLPDASDPCEPLLQATDRPLVEPIGTDGRLLNHPANLRVVVAGLSRFLGESHTSLAARLDANFQRLFGPARHS